MKAWGFKIWTFVFFVLFLDQLTKVLVKTNLNIGDEILIAPWFIIHFVENNGFAFGFQFFGFWGKLFLTLFRIVFVVILFRWLNGFLKTGIDNRVFFAFLLIFIGAIGNIIDSVFYGVIFDYAPLFFGKVVDMFYFPLISGIYPDWIPFLGGKSFVFFRFIFNIADSCITVGGLILLIFYKKIPIK